jgi:hypothetical protein
MTGPDQALKARYAITPFNTGQRTVALVTTSGTPAASPVKLRHRELLVAPQPPAGPGSLRFDLDRSSID